MESIKGPAPASIAFQKQGIIYNFTSYHKEIEGRFSVYIPAYKMFLSAKTKEEIKNKSIFMVKSFYEFHLKQNGLKNFMLEIHKLGFRTKNHDFIMKNLINGRPTNSKFNQNIVDTPKNFNIEDAEAVNVEEMIEC